MAEGASGSVTILSPETVANLDNVSLYTMSLSNQDGLSSAQIMYKGGVVVQLLPTNTNIDVRVCPILRDNNVQSSTYFLDMAVGGMSSCFSRRSDWYPLCTTPRVECRLYRYHHLFDRR